MIRGEAARTGLPDASVDAVFGEAMLTMQTDAHKADIVAEAFRVLRPAGRYAIHELALRPDGVDDSVKTEIRTALARSIKVNARPLTAAEWTNLLTAAGFDLQTVSFAPMARVGASPCGSRRGPCTHPAVCGQCRARRRRADSCARNAQHLPQAQGEPHRDLGDRRQAGLTRSGWATRTRFSFAASLSAVRRKGRLWLHIPDHLRGA